MQDRTSTFSLLYTSPESNMQQYSSPLALNNLPVHSQASQQQQTDDENIASLNTFLGITSKNMPPLSPAHQQQPADALASSSNQAIAAFLASTTSAAYTNVPAISLPIQESPVLLNSIGITPAQSIQSIQFSDLGSDMGSNSLFGQPMVSSAGFDHSSVNMLSNSTSAQRSPGGVAVDQSFLHQPHVTQRFLAPSGSFDQHQQPYQLGTNASSSALGKHRRADGIGQSLFEPIGVPLSKRVSMPVNMSCGTSANADIINTVGQADGYPTPLPTGTVMQRIASYHPGVPIAATAQQQALIGNSMNGSADGVGFSFAPAKVPVNRLNTTTAVMASASSNTESSVFDGNIQAASPPPAHRKVAHNAIERRYRNNINDRIRDLRNSVPALQNIRAKGSKQQRLGGVDINNEENDDDIDDENDTEEVAIVDGVVAATKLNKATVLGKSTEYIYHLRRNNDLYKRESLYLQEMIRKMPDGDKVIARVLQMTRRDSAVATAALFMPESSSPPRPKKRRRT